MPESGRAPRSTRSRVLLLLRIGIALVTLAAVAYAVISNWAEVSVELAKVSLAEVALALLLAGLGTWVTMLGWKVLLADLGSPLHAAPASGVYFVGQLGKYLPGSLWSVLVQADIAAHLRVPRRRTAVAGLLALGLALLTGFLVGLPAVGFVLRERGGSGWWFALAVPVVVLLLLPPLLNRIIALLLRVMRRDPLEHELSSPAVLRAVALFVLVWALFGAHTLALAHAVSHESLHRDLVVAAVCGYAFAVSLGMLTVVLPAGLGARDVLLTLVLAAVIGIPAAGAVALLSRFIVTLVDVLAALAGWAYARTHHLLGRQQDELGRQQGDPEPS